MFSPDNKAFFKESMDKSMNKINPLLPNFHYKMLKQLKNYHMAAKKNPNFSLLQSLKVLSKFCTTDIWLNRIVNEEIDFLKYKKVKNPYHDNKSS